MLTLQTITTVTPIRTDAELAQAQQRLDELLTENAYESPSQDVRDEFEVLTALIHYYEQRTRDPREWSLAGADVTALLADALSQRHLSVAAAAEVLQVSPTELEQVLSRQQTISLTLAKRLHQRLGISAEALLTLPE